MRSRTIRIPEAYRSPLAELSGTTAPIAARSGLSVLAVGGSVRDLIDDRPHRGDWDLVVLGPEGCAGELARALAESWGWRPPVSFARFGTHMVHGPSGQVEVSEAGRRTTIRREEDPLVADAMTRDFTLNALYLDVARPLDSSRATIIDPTGRGIDDLEARVLRTPLAPRLIFADDPLRIVRAARLRATRGYRVLPSVARAARALTPRLADVSPERVRDEINRILLADEPAAGFQMLARNGIVALLMPEIQGMVGFRQDTPHHYPDLFRHSLRVVSRCPGDLVTRWAALLHDCGKPATRVRAPGGDTYYGHEAVGAEMARALLTRLRAGRRLIAEVEALVRLHMVHYHAGWSRRAVKRFIYRAGEHLPRLLDLLVADASSVRRRAEKLRAIAELERRVDEVRQEVFLSGSPLSGREVMALLDLPPGPDVGRAKRMLAEAVAEGLVEPDAASARDYLLKKWKGPGGKPG